ncbi:hypothetical protein N9S32_01320 [Candidatus Actinomarina]|nr:hypothetical protein [Candidatus Actinomarina sp.]
MKKVITLLLIFIGACGGSIEEASVLDTTTTEVKIVTTTSTIETTSTTIKDSEDIKGLTVLYMGHSFGRPFAENLTQLTEFSGIKGHNQRIVTRGGEKGAPQAMWEDKTAKNEIKSNLNDGSVDVVILICCSQELYESNGQSDQSIVEIMEYALSKNPNTRFGLSMPWADFPNDYNDASEHRLSIDAAYPRYQQFAKILTGLFKDVDIFTFYHGAAIYELRDLFEKDMLQDIENLIGPRRNSIFNDEKGHAGLLAIDTGTLIWINAIYGVNPMDIPKIEKYQLDIREVAAKVLNLYS